MTTKHTSKTNRNSNQTSRPAVKRKMQAVVVIRAPRPGQRCPQCKKGRLDYDGLLNLSCPVCGYSAGGGGCT